MYQHSSIGSVCRTKFPFEIIPSKIIQIQSRVILLVDLNRKFVLQMRLDMFQLSLPQSRPLSQKLPTKLVLSIGWYLNNHHDGFHIFRTGFAYVPEQISSILVWLILLILWLSMLCVCE